MTLRILTTTLAIFALAGCATAPPDNPHKVWIHAASYHWDRSCDCNEFNPGVGVEWQLSAKWSVETGAFINSFHDDTMYVWFGREFHDGPDYRGKSTIGPADGWDDKEFRDGEALIVPGATFERGRGRGLVLPSVFGFSGLIKEFGDGRQ